MLGVSRLPLQRVTLITSCQGVVFRTVNAIARFSRHIHGSLTERATQSGATVAGGAFPPSALPAQVSAIAPTSATAVALPVRQLCGAQLPPRSSIFLPLAGAAFYSEGAPCGC